MRSFPQSTAVPKGPSRASVGFDVSRCAEKPAGLGRYHELPARGDDLAIPADMPPAGFEPALRERPLGTPGVTEHEVIVPETLRRKLEQLRSPRGDKRDRSEPVS